MSPERVKILFVLPNLQEGGAEQVSTHLLRHLDRSRFEPHVALLSLDGVYIEDLPQDVEVHKIGGSRVRYALPGIIRIVRKVKPKIILSTLAHMNFCVLVAKPFFPRGTAVFVREASPPTEIAKMEGFSSVRKILERGVYRFANLVICPSDMVRTDVIRHYKIDSRKALRIYNPVDVGRLQESAQAEASPYQGDGPHIVAVGRLAREKGFDLLVSAMLLVRKAYPGAALAILGRGTQQKELERQARDLGLNGAVRFWGYQRNPCPFIKHADLFVLSSRYEGLPNAMLEAMALNKPVVATDCPGGVAEVQRYFPNMTLVQPENPEALAQGIISACKMTQNRSTEGHGSNAFLDEFGLGNILERYSKLLLS